MLKEKDIIKALNYGLYRKDLPRKKKKQAKIKAKKWCLETYKIVWPNGAACV
jgi:hypothetical protein